MFQNAFIFFTCFSAGMRSFEFQLILTFLIIGAIGYNHYSQKTEFLIDSKMALIFTVLSWIILGAHLFYKEAIFKLTLVGALILVVIGTAIATHYYKDSEYTISKMEKIGIVFLASLTLI